MTQLLATSTNTKNSVLYERSWGYRWFLRIYGCYIEDIEYLSSTPSWRNAMVRVNVWFLHLRHLAWCVSMSA